MPFELRVVGVPDGYDAADVHELIEVVDVLMISAELCAHANDAPEPRSTVRRNSTDQLQHEGAIANVRQAEN